MEKDRCLAIPDGLDPAIRGYFDNTCRLSFNLDLAGQVALVPIVILASDHKLSSRSYPLQGKFILGLGREPDFDFLGFVNICPEGKMAKNEEEETVCLDHVRILKVSRLRQRLSDQFGNGAKAVIDEILGSA